MKFIPQQYRESQADWFGKRGISWHISVVYRRVDGELQSQSFIHVIQSCSQDSPTIVIMMEHLLRTLKAEHPEIESALFRQDNAGCYHSSITVLACHALEATGVKIKGLDFSDPQGGKGAADRLAATAKSHIRYYVNEGNDVTTAQQMCDALQSYGGLEGVRVAALKTIDESLPSHYHAPKLPGINKYNNFRFSSGKLLAWRAYSIGSGKQIQVTLSSGKNLFIVVIMLYPDPYAKILLVGSRGGEEGANKVFWDQPP